MNLEENWTQPTQHEKLIYPSKVLEIFYTRITAFFISYIILIPFIIDYLVISFVLFGFSLLILYPLFVRPWQIILSNKRLILRHQYWNISRFSTIISFNLAHLDSQRITPRIKILPITLGFAILTNYSIPLIQYNIDNSIPTPLLFSVFFIFAGSVSIVGDVESARITFLQYLFDPFLDFSLAFGLIFLLLSILLILFGMPRKTKMILSSTGGHRLTLDAGIDEKLTDLLFAVGRKHRIKEVDNSNPWTLPLFDDEVIKTRASVGLIERKTQILGLLSLIVFMDSVDQTIALALHPNPSNLLILLIKLFSLLFIWYTVVFSKKYRRIIATSHRLLYQEERLEISGLWGKRIYSYSDLPYENIQGFKYSNFSGIRANNLVGAFIILFASSALMDLYQTLFMVLFTSFIIFLYIIINYKTFTSLTFFSISGDKVELLYQIPVFLAILSHKLETRTWLYDKIFPNILSEQEVADICNQIRNVESPKLPTEETHDIKVDVFIDQHDEEIHTWEKIGPFRFARGSAILGAITSIIIAIFLFSKVAVNFQMMFVGLAIIIIAMNLMSRLILRHRTLIVMKKRLFFIDQILPRKIAQIFGILPERSIQEVSIEHVLVSKFKFVKGENFGSLIRYLLIIGIMLYLIFVNPLIMAYFAKPIFDFLTMLCATIIISLIIPLIRSLFEVIPRYALKIYTRFGIIQMPYIQNLEKFTTSLKEAKAI